MKVQMGALILLRRVCGNYLEIIETDGPITFFSSVRKPE
jgi:hypothetical protein